MENQEYKNHQTHSRNSHEKNDSLSASIAVVIAAIVIFGLWMYTQDGQDSRNTITGNQNVLGRQHNSLSADEEAIIPSNGVILPVSWGNLGARLIKSGVIDGEKFMTLYEEREQFSKEYENLLLKDNNGKIKITKDNAGYLLNLFWALGLANKNNILDSGEMTDSRYGGAGNFASTGGWTMSVGDPMNHYSQHIFFSLTQEQQVLVDKISKGIYRPCCGNSAHFPDCNHGMAMLGLLELMASQGVSEQDMWKTALAVNSYWFPDTYITIATYMKNKGIEWKDVNPQEVLGVNYSSGQGFANISSQVVPVGKLQGGSGCGVEFGQPAPVQQRQQSGCGI